MLIDCLLLPRTNFLLKCTSAIGEFALCFNPMLSGIDLNEQTGSLPKLQLTAIEVRHKLWLRLSAVQKADLIRPRLRIRQRSRAGERRPVQRWLVFRNQRSKMLAVFERV